MSDTTRSYTADTSDRRMVAVDIQGSIAHAKMLGETGIITDDESQSLVTGLSQIGAEGLDYLDSDEDVHSAVERRLYEILGDVAGKLHTGRSRNDQVATDLRLYLREAGDDLVGALGGWIRTLVDISERTGDISIPTFTHLQQAQVTSLGNHLLAYAWMAVRDLERFKGCVVRLSESPLGSGASAGSSLPLDRSRTSEMLEFSGPMSNTLDAVGSRDFVAEYVFCCAQTMTHLSRLAGELILWASSEFGWVSLSDAVSTGSSALPHKRNPDIAELVRGRSAGVIGDVGAVLALQKGLPLTYNRDLQEDKRIVFHSHDVLIESLQAMTELISGVEFHAAFVASETGALGLAEKLAGRGVPFREAHDVVGGLIRSLEERAMTLGDVDAEQLVAHDDRFRPDDVPVEPALPDLRDQIADLRALL